MFGPTVQHLRESDYKRMPWKNGRGETVEIAIFPPGASVDDFAWRISMATVAEDGPFSMFIDIDRTLTVLSGEGIRLRVQGQDPVELTTASAPLSFPADAACAAELTGGPITDLNVMTRRGNFIHEVRRVTSSSDPAVDLSGGTAFFFCRTGELTVSVGAETKFLRPLDCLQINEGQALTADLGGAGEGLLITLRPV